MESISLAGISSPINLAHCGELNKESAPQSILKSQLENLVHYSITKTTFSVIKKLILTSCQNGTSLQKGLKDSPLATQSFINVP
jgi:hypothetical protein